MKHYTVYIDGGCLYNGTPEGKGSYGIVINLGQPDEVLLKGLVPVAPCTNNIAELHAFIVAMEYLEEVAKGRADITVYTDSNYLVQGYNQWLSGWISKGYKTSAGTPVANQKLWQDIALLKELVSTKVTHVKGHSGIAGNELADALATEALRQNLGITKEEVPMDSETKLREVLKNVLEMLKESGLPEQSDDANTILQYIELNLN